MVWDVFCRYEAVNDSEEGKATFWQSIYLDEYLDMLTAYGAYEDNRLIGIIATRSEGAHIALFFVAGAYQKRGVGRKLFEECLKNDDHQRITVHASEYAVNVYKRLGFVRSVDMQGEGGIRFIPMVFER